MDRGEREPAGAQALEQRGALCLAPRCLADREQRERAGRREVAVVELADVVDAAGAETVELRYLRDPDCGLIEDAVNTAGPC